MKQQQSSNDQVRGTGNRLKSRQSTLPLILQKRPEPFTNQTLTLLGEAFVKEFQDKSCTHSSIRFEGINSHKTGFEHQF